MNRPGPAVRDAEPAHVLADALARAFPKAQPVALGVALSGGGDSVALTALLADWAMPRGVDLYAATVDHGLRPEATAEAAQAAQLCARLGIHHDTLQWRNWDGRGNLQDAARRARYRLIADWARARGLDAICLGHTLDDQAETVLMRLARGSGVDGLSGMAPARQASGVIWLRPLLDARRGALRADLIARGLIWAEDPSNADPRFARVEARAALAALAPLGVTARGLADTAARMAAAREVLSRAAATAAARHVTIEHGDVTIDLQGLLNEPGETRERLMAHALNWVAGADYAPRRTALQRLLLALEQGKGGTLHGCAITLEPSRHPRTGAHDCGEQISDECRSGVVRVSREWRAVRDLTAPIEALWDGRWRLKGPKDRDAKLYIAAVGASGLTEVARSLDRAQPDTVAGQHSARQQGRRDGKPQATGWRGTGLPRRSLLASPAVWQDRDLVAAPLAGYGRGWSAHLTRDAADFHASLFAH